MKNALVAAIVAAAVASGTALATRSAPQQSEPHTPPAPHGPPGHDSAPGLHAPSSHPPAPRVPGSHQPSHSPVTAMIAKWNATHSSWANPAAIVRAAKAQAASHAVVSAPPLSPSSRALRIIAEYGVWATMPPKLRALERKAGMWIPAGVPYVPPSEYVPAARLRLVRAALRAARRP